MATCETPDCGLEVDQQHLDELRINGRRHDGIECFGCLTGERRLELRERMWSQNEAMDIAAMLQQYVELAFKTDTSAADVNRYLLEVRNFMFRLRPIRAPRALEVVR